MAKAVKAINNKVRYTLAVLLLLLTNISNAQNWLNLSAGGTQYVNVGDLDVAGNKITVEALVTQTASGVDVVSKHTGPPNANYLLRMGSFEFTTSTSFYSLPSTFSYNNNEVYHIAATYDGATAKYYVNGCLVNSIPATGNLTQNNLATAIGNQSNCGCEQFVGYIDEVRIWNVARTQAELETNMNIPLPTPGSQAGLMGYYQFEGSMVNAQGNATFNGNAIGGASTGANPNASTPLVAPIVLGTSFTDALCNGDNNGSIVATGFGGAGLYEYSMDGTNYQASGNFGGLSAGAYTVYVSWQNSCTATANVTIEEPVALSINVTDTTHVSCNGGNNGKIVVAGQGGTPNYSYAWSNAGNSATITGLTAGTYTVTITDQNACTVTQSYTLTQPIALSATILGSTNASCPGIPDGTAQADGLGGTPTYTFLWTGGQTTPTATGFAAGTYTVTVTDNNSCTATTNVTITEPGPMTASITVGHHVSCFGGSDAEATATGTGGVLNYSYAWSNGEANSVATSLAAGNPSVTIIDANGCTAMATTTITEPSLLTSSITDSTDALCHGSATGSATVTATGGTPNYTYLWTNNALTANASNLAPGTFSVTVTDSKGCTTTSDILIGEPDTLLAAPTGIVSVSCNGGSDGEASVMATGGVPTYAYSWPGNLATQQITGLTSGAYTVTVTDANGCTALATAMVNQPAVLTVAMTNVSNISCFGMADGEATATATGGVFPYTYAWSNGGVSNIEGGLQVGVNSVTVTDTKGCVASASTTISEPTEVTVAVGGAQVLCFGTSASITANAGGGNGPYTYHWNNGFVGQPVTVSPNTSTDYWVFAKDANGCASGFDTVSIYVLPILTANQSPDFEICNGDSGVISVAPTGGGSNYYYDWSDGNTGPGPYTVYPDTTTVYTITVTDNCGSPPSVRTITATVYPLPVVDFVGDTLEGCVPHTVNFENNTTIESGGILSWDWQFGDGEGTDFIAPAYIYDIDSTFTVKLIATSKKGCVDSLVRPNYITTRPIPTADFTPDESIVSIIYANVNFEDQSSGATTWLWSFGDSTTSSLQSPSHLYPDTGTYFVNLYVENEFGCSAQATNRIIVEPLFKIYIPNTFTPDDDFINDTFRPIGVGFESFDMTIYDRWGNLVFKDSGKDIAWDGFRRTGIEAEQAVYVYYIYFRDIAGKQQRIRGMVTLIR